MSDGLFTPHSYPSNALDEAKALRARVAELEKRLADCVVWMDTREKHVPGLPRLCDQALAALKDTSTATQRPAQRDDDAG